MYQEYCNCLFDFQLKNTEKPTEAESGTEKVNKWEVARENQINEESRYFKLLKMILDKLTGTFAASSTSSADNFPLFKKFLLEIPDLTPFTFDLLKNYSESEDETLVKLGLESLCELSLFRSSLRDHCLSILLNYSTIPNPKHLARNQALRIISEELFSQASMVDKIVNYSINVIQSLKKIKQLQTPSSNDASKANSSAAATAAAPTPNENGSVDSSKADTTPNPPANSTPAPPQADNEDNNEAETNFDSSNTTSGTEKGDSQHTTDQMEIDTTSTKEGSGESMDVSNQPSDNVDKPETDQSQQQSGSTPTKASLENPSNMEVSEEHEEESTSTAERVKEMLQLHISLTLKKNSLVKEFVFFPFFFFFICCVFQLREYSAPPSRLQTFQQNKKRRMRTGVLRGFTY